MELPEWTSANPCHHKYMENNSGESVFAFKAQVAELMFLTKTCPSLSKDLMLTGGNSAAGGFFLGVDNQAPEEIWVQALSEGLSVEEANERTLALVKARVLGEGECPSWLMHSNALGGRSWASPHDWLMAELGNHLEVTLTALFDSWESKLGVQEQNAGKVFRVGHLLGKGRGGYTGASLAAYEVLKSFKIDSRPTTGKTESFFFACNETTFEWASRRIQKGGGGRGVFQELRRVFSAQELSSASLETATRLFQDSGEDFEDATFQKYLKTGRCLED